MPLKIRARHAVDFNLNFNHGNRHIVEKYNRLVTVDGCVCVCVCVCVRVCVYV
jgi:hypothetical protein